MRTDILTIINGLISNIQAVKVSTGSSSFRDNLREIKFLGLRTIKAIEHIRNNWPKLTQDEMQEIDTIIEALKITYDYTRAEMQEDNLSNKSFV